MPDPVSWLVVERGWKVLGSDGSKLGSVDEVLGDTGNDIFDGLAVSPGLLKNPRYVPAEQVSEIVEGSVGLDLDEDAFGQLPDYRGEIPPQAS